jgi:hypothetical protein
VLLAVCAMLHYHQQPQAYRDWQRIVTQRMAHLSKPQAVVLAMWSFGIVMTHSCGLSTVSEFLSKLLEQPENTLRERLRQWYKEAWQKGNRKRAAVAVSASFLPLLQWILSWWSATDKQVVLAMDASNLGQRFTVLLISVVYRGCGLPVAWKIVKGSEPGSWRPHWLELLQQLKGGIPSDWWVLVTSDRGLYAPWLYDAIVSLGWHPFMRINAQGHYQVAGESQYRDLSGVVSQVGQEWSGRVRCFKSHSLACTLLARWDEGYSDPWLIVTDLAPQQANICWYGMRSWIECLFKDIKRGGFGWHHTKMQDPQRVERLWLAIAVAMVWLVSVGGQGDATPCISGLPSLPQADTSVPSIPTAHGSSTPASASAAPVPHRRSHWLGCLKRGFLTILAAVIKGQPIPLGRFIPEPLPIPQPIPVLGQT